MPTQPSLHLRHWSRAAIFVLAAVPAPVHAQFRLTQPQDLALRDVRLSFEDKASLSTVIVRNGRITSITDAAVDPPADVRVVDARSFVVTPSFIDAYTFTGCTTPQPVADQDIPPRTAADVMVDMRQANRKGIQPSFRAASAFALDTDPAKAYRASGFGALASSPHGQLLSGISALATTREAAPRDAFVVPELFDVMGFDATGPGYPATPMGALAQLRQFFHDARRHVDLVARRQAGKPVSHLPYDEDFQAVQAALSKSRRILCEAETAAEIDRFVALADELDLQIAICGGREAWRRADLLQQRGIPVFLSLQWGDEPEDPHAKDKKKNPAGEAEPDAADPDAAKPDATQPDATPDVTPDATPDETVKEPPQEGRRGRRGRGATRDSDDGEKDDAKSAPDEWTYEEPLRVREEKRRLWEETRDGAKVLAQAGVPIAFGSGKDAPKDLVARVRTLVEHGLPPDVAWSALTSGAARLLGVERELGRVEKGRAASLALWSKDPLRAKDAQLGWLLVEGRLYTFDLDEKELRGKPDSGVDADGTWVLAFDAPDSKPATAELEMEKDGTVKGVIRFPNPSEDSELTGEFSGSVAGKRLRLDGRVKIGGFEADVVVEGTVEGDSIQGEARWKFSGGEETRKFTAAREPKEMSR